METDTDILARTIYGEARGGGRVLMSAVANTIMNRTAKKSWYGKTIGEVCKKPYQFSCWNADDPNCSIIQDVNDNDPAYAIALDIAAHAVTGNLKDNTAGATHYYSTYIDEPKWAEGKTPCASIGNMLFYNDIDL